MKTIKTALFAAAIIASGAAVASFAQPEGTGSFASYSQPEGTGSFASYSQPEGTGSFA